MTTSVSETTMLQKANSEYSSAQNHDEPQLDVPSSRVDHLGASRQYWRDMILGVNDGIISTFLLVTGVAGGGLSSHDILLTSIAGSIAGAVSMCAGEYVATKSQNEVITGELALERIHITKYFDEELSELGELMNLIGISKDQALRRQMRQFYENNPDSLLQLMAVLEFGVIDSEQRSPIQAGVFSGLLFAAGSLPSIIPFFIFNDNPSWGVVSASILTITALMMVGVVKTWATRTNWVSAAVENLIIAGCGGLLAYSVGELFSYLIGTE